MLVILDHQNRPLIYIDLIILSLELLLILYIHYLYLLHLFYKEIIEQLVLMEVDNHQHHYLVNFDHVTILLNDLNYN